MANRRKFTLAVILILMFFCTAIATAAPKNHGHSNGRFEQGPIDSVYFFPQDRDPNDGMFGSNPWGLMSYRLWGNAFQFLFKGYNLDPRTSYTLIYYPEGDAVVLLGSGTTNRRGQLNFRGRADICSLPSTMDANFFLGARLMLVPTAGGLNDGMSLNLGDEDNLISYHAVRFTDTDGCSIETPETPPEDNGQAPPDVPEEEINDGTDDTPPPADDYDNDPDIVYPY